MSCLFCKIINKEISTNIIYEDDLVLAFDDINPQASIHKLIIPRKHIATINDMEAIDQPLLGAMIMTAKKLAQELDVADNGYRLVMNCNAHGGQTVFHIHLHLLGGRHFNWPPG